MVENAVRPGAAEERCNVRDRLAAFLYWAAHWLERAADRVWYGPMYGEREWTVTPRWKR